MKLDNINTRKLLRVLIYLHLPDTSVNSRMEGKKEECDIILQCVDILNIYESKKSQRKHIFQTYF